MATRDVGIVPTKSSHFECVSGQSVVGMGYFILSVQSGKGEQMSRLIDANALEKDGWTMHRIVQVDKETMSYQTKKPTDFPAIEPEIVRCKDCKYWKDEFEKNKSSCWLPCMNMATHRNWFCGSAERREDD